MIGLNWGSLKEIVKLCLGLCTCMVRVLFVKEIYSDFFPLMMLLGSNKLLGCQEYILNAEIRHVDHEANLD